VVFFAGWFDSCQASVCTIPMNKCYGMLDKRKFCIVLLCVVNVNCSIKQSS